MTEYYFGSFSGKQKATNVYAKPQPLFTVATTKTKMTEDNEKLVEIKLKKGLFDKKNRYLLDLNHMTIDSILMHEIAESDVLFEIILILWKENKELTKKLMIEKKLASVSHFCTMYALDEFNKYNSSPWFNADLKKLDKWKGEAIEKELLSV